MQMRVDVGGKQGLTQKEFYRAFRARFPFSSRLLLALHLSCRVFFFCVLLWKEAFVLPCRIKERKKHAPGLVDKAECDGKYKRY